ncbi:hypothetical protein DFH94DRAFT_688587 [Russula ochroleuca]|uniref:Uncharacterized protein n=1 Tax=Russula ochroleuca TaxID=152965 RepID=A0A9P5N4X1_9AGAM|nr:hypothetical protein DFH94DRAFT_688587 [Russula ochroleuca]
MASGETAVVGVPDASALALPSPPFDSSRLPPFPSPSDNHGYLSPPNPILRSEVDRTSIENGQRIFGQNIVSRRLIKSWLQQMWLGLKDKVLATPDERPRQSVANLIGRFEQQQKRQSTSSVPPSRATSATSNNTGNAVKEERRIAREWLPVKTNGNANETGASSSPPAAPATLRGIISITPSTSSFTATLVHPL